MFNIRVKTMRKFVVYYYSFMEEEGEKNEVKEEVCILN